ncbi:MAG: prepilin-type N-terminal cleavage/methylation domain-containing protein [Candidatus Omnitrophica bacterium]|nr:prepilin-type N-terminal cleavage/methylation domain-containing protein [Candidatus Omnitrophota bacterium]
MNRKGFTLIELMVVIAIIGILSAALLPSISNLTDKANAAKVVSLTDTLRTACDAHYMDVGYYARENSAGTGATWHRLAFDFGATGWDGPYLKTPLSYADNPWKGQVYMYMATAGANGGNASATGGDGFDLDGDGSDETGITTAWYGGNMIRLWLFRASVQPLVNSLLDGDNETTPTGMGKFEYWGTNGTVYITGGR